MKVRVKLAGRAQAVDVGDVQQCTLSHLQQRTADVFELGETSFTLSLNKKDILSGEDQTLSQLGIVAGDLIFVLCPDVPASPSTSVNSSASTGDNRVVGNPQDTVSTEADQHTSEGQLPVPKSMSVSQAPCQEENSAVAANEQPLTSYTEEDQAAASTSDQYRIIPSPASPSPLEDPEVNRCLQEPLLCRESTPTSVPVLLRDIFGGAGCASASDALWVVLHTLMLEVGFRPCQEDDFSLGKEWNRRGFYRQNYRHLCVSAQHSCSLIGVPMGKVVVVHGVTNGDPPLKTDPQSLKVTDYVQDHIDQEVCSVYKSLERLSRTVKDLICQQMMSQLSEECGFALSAGLLSLSYELKLKVLSYLDVESLTRMGQVCRDFSVAYKDPYLWRRLFLREFGQNGDNSLNKNWYQLFTEAYQMRKDRRRLSRYRQHQMMTAIPPWLHFPSTYMPPSLAPPHYPEGLIGGDYDINPEFASSIPHPLGGQPFNPNPLLPQRPSQGGGYFPRPRFDDPFGPGGGPRPHFMVQRGAGGSRRNARNSTFPSLGGRARFC